MAIVESVVFHSSVPGSGDGRSLPSAMERFQPCSLDMWPTWHVVEVFVVL